MGRIILLDELTANKIAAGEVVERPASVVKELVENSIDAGSSRIEISIVDGGLSMLSVSDNGLGMDAGDARLAFERHATSKISSAADLDAIKSLGFRGEALPSIAAVSRLTLKTRMREKVSGIEVVMEGGKLKSISETGCPVGTIVEVYDLFFNTPARKKHMKSPAAEAGVVSEVINRFAMGYPEISFQLKNNERIILKTTGKGELIEGIAAVHGLAAAREMLAVKVDTAATRVRGFIGKPSLSRAGRTHQTIYINGRFVRNRGITEAVERAYHSMLMVGRHPVFVLNISIEPEEVDVNVHPAKTEVRLYRAQSLEDLITSAVSVALAENCLIPSAQEDRVPVKAPWASITEEVRQEEWKISYLDLARQESGEFQPVSISEQPEISEYVKQPENTDAEDPVNIADEKGQQNSGYPGFPDLRPVAQIDCTYIVAQGEDGMYLIDQHAAHERILYEKYMERPEVFVASEQELFTETIQLTFQESQVLYDNIINFSDLGFVIEHFGGESFLLRGVPAGTSKNGGREIFLDLLDYFSHNRATITGKALREKFLITMACKNAIKANHKLGLPEMESLLGRLAKTRNPYTCPHGRPTMIHFSGYDLEKRFKRVV